MTGKIYQNIPDSVGMNVFQADPAMADLLRIYLPPAILPTALAEAGRLWHEPRYTAQARTLLAQVAVQEVAVTHERGVVAACGGRPRRWCPEPRTPTRQC